MSYYIKCQVGYFNWVSISEHDYHMFCNHLVDLDYIREEYYRHSKKADNCIILTKYIRYSLYRGSKSVPYKSIYFCTRELI